MANIANKYHYFYKITNNLNGHFYYGVHNTNNLNDGYMGSGTRLHYAYKKYGIENFTKEILKFFDTSKEAFEYESEVVNEDLIKDDNCYNIKQGGEGWQTIGLITVKDKDGNCFDVQKDDPRYLSGELVGVTKGLITAKDKNGNYHTILTNDKKYLSGEYFSNLKNMIHVIDSSGNEFSVSKDDPRYLSGELKHFCSNKILVKDINNKFYWIDKNDEKYLSGKVQNFWKDKKHKEKSLLKMKETFKYIGHQQGEKNSQYGTCWIYNDKECIKIKKEQLEEYISKGWIRGRKMKS
jgi:hypothetical protein